MTFARNAVLVGTWAYALKLHVFDVTYGLGPSMTPTLPDGSFIVFERLSRHWRPYTRGDVVQLLSPTRSNGTTVCKRIVAIEGDTVTLQPRFEADRAATIKVPKGHVWVEGDNATQSVDSRQIGAVPASLVLGRALCIVWPWKHASIVR